MTARIACHARTAHLRRAHSRRNAELELITQRSRAPRMPAYGLKSSGNDEARHAGVWTCAFALMDSWSCVSPKFPPCRPGLNFDVLCDQVIRVPGGRRM